MNLMEKASNLVVGGADLILRMDMSQEYLGHVRTTWHPFLYIVEVKPIV